MAQLDFYYGNQKVNEDIKNWRDLEIEVNFDNDDGGHGTVRSGELIFTGGLAEKINNWNAAGLGVGPGIFEAPQFRIDVCGSGNAIFEGGINTAACETLYECDEVTAPLRANGIDRLSDLASSFSWQYLADVRGIIGQSDYILVPYVINSIPDYFNVIVAGLSLFAIVKEFREVIEKTVSLVNDLTGDTSMAVGSIVNPVIATAMAIGRVLVDIIKITLYIAYLLFIVRAMIDLIRMIFDNLIQPVKYKKGMRVVDLFQKACNHLGFGFSSSILTGAHINDVIVPRKTALTTNKTVVQNIFGLKNLKRKDYDDSKNPSSVGYPDGTFSDLIVNEEQRLNCKARVIGNTLYFETEEFFASIANYTLPDIKNKNADPHSTNACELASNYKISYQLDDQDNNTYDSYEGTSAQMILSLRTFQNQKNILLKNITEVNLAYSLAKRKEQLSAVEEVVGTLYDLAAEVYNTITGFINKVLQTIDKIIKAIANLTGANPPGIKLIDPFPPNPIQARIGMMLLGSDFIGVNKIMVIDSSNKLHSNNERLTSARYLIDELHFSNFAIRFADSFGNPKNDHNQWLIYTDKEIPFCCADYESILKNNFIKTFDKKLAKVKSLIWNPYTNKARITYRVKELYTKNFNQSYLIT